MLRRQTSAHILVAADIVPRAHNQRIPFLVRTQVELAPRYGHPLIGFRLIMVLDAGAENRIDCLMVLGCPTIDANGSRARNPCVRLWPMMRTFSPRVLTECPSRFKGVRPATDGKKHVGGKERNQKVVVAVLMRILMVFLVY